MFVLLLQVIFTSTIIAGELLSNTKMELLIKSFLGGYFIIQFTASYKTLSIRATLLNSFLALVLVSLFIFVNQS